MKTAVIKNRTYTTIPQIPYPNAASKDDMLHKLLDLLIVGAIGAGLDACLIFLTVLG